ncbi:MAG: hypothetical protein G8345_18075 [Magnetococcales bacterium]|nr:hypothetical protein [Magnetococcales bacterium]NGZ28784.1 hypothetical protein [Magnetococcales bacterium]
MRNNRSELSSSRSAQGMRRLEKGSVLANQKIGRRPRPSQAAVSEGGGGVTWRMPLRRSQVSFAHRLILRLLHDGFWLLAVVGLSIKWVVELFTGDAQMRQNREQVAVEPDMDEWEEGPQHDHTHSQRSMIEPWDEVEVVATANLQDFESMKMASLEAEEKELSEEELTDQAASLRSRLERDHSPLAENKAG